MWAAIDVQQNRSVIKSLRLVTISLHLRQSDTDDLPSDLVSLIEGRLPALKERGILKIQKSSGLSFCHDLLIIINIDVIFSAANIIYIGALILLYKIDMVSYVFPAFTFDVTQWDLREWCNGPDQRRDSTLDLGYAASDVWREVRA